MTYGQLYRQLPYGQQKAKEWKDRIKKNYRSTYYAWNWINPLAHTDVGNELYFCKLYERIMDIIEAAEPVNNMDVWAGTERQIDYFCREMEILKERAESKKSGCTYEKVELTYEKLGCTYERINLEKDK